MLGLGRSWWLSTQPTGQRVTKEQTANLCTSTLQHPPGYYSSERKFCFLTSTSCTNTHTKPWSCSRQLYQLSCMPGIVQNCLTKDWFLAGYGFHESSPWVHVESTELHLPCLQQPKHLALSNIVLQLFCDKVKQLK